MKKITKIILITDIALLIASIFIVKLDLVISLVFIVASLILLPIGARLRKIETSIGIRVKMRNKPFNEEPQFLVISLILFLLTIASIIIKNDRFSYTMLMGISLGIYLLRKPPQFTSPNS